MNEKKYLLPDDAYQVMKWLGLIAFPAVAVFVGVVGPVWGMPEGLCKALVATFNAVGVLVGALIGVSQVKAKDVSDDGE